MQHIYHQPQFGENWFTFPCLYSRMVKLFPSGSRFVEVGSWKGKSSAYMAVEIANSKKDIEFYCVDTWQGSVEHQGMDLSNLYDVFINNMKPVEKYYFPLKLSSLEAAQKFKDNSLDFVFIDASHEYEDVKKDIEAWLPKVKSGGILAGHDYDPYWPDVVRAVNESLKVVFADEHCFVYYKNKLGNFPSINCVTIEESEHRRSVLKEKMTSYGLHDINFHIFPRYKEGDCKLIGSRIDKLHFHSKGPVTSHLKAIKNWLNNTNEDYTFFCEDDLGLNTVPYWNFNWTEFYNNLPPDWECVQLAWIREADHFFDFGYKLRNRCWCDWSGCAYLIKRSFAQKLIDHYHPNDYFFLEYQGADIELREWWALIPTIETIIFSNLGKVYSFPLFVEDTVGCQSTYVQNGQGYLHHDSHQTVMDLWEHTLSSMSIPDIIPFRSQIIVQLGAHFGHDHLTKYITENNIILNPGLFIEANPEHIDKLKECYKQYSNIIIENVAIKKFNDPNDTLTLYVHDNDREKQAVSFDIDHVKKHEQYWGPGNITSIQVPCTDLHSILDKHNIRYIDWLLIDLEGLETDIIMNLDFNKYYIKVIQFEYVHLGDNLCSVVERLASFGYNQVVSTDEKDMTFERHING